VKRSRISVCRLFQGDMVLAKRVTPGASLKVAANHEQPTTVVFLAGNACQDLRRYPLQ